MPVTVIVAVLAAVLLEVTTVSVDEPPAVTVAGENVAVTFGGNPPMLKTIDCVLPLSAVVLTAYVPDAPATTVRDAGDTAVVKSDPAVTVSDAVAECDVAPDVPVTVNVVNEAAMVVVTVRVDEPPAVTVAGTNEPLAPAGRPATLSAIDCVLPFTAAVDTVYVVEAPAATVRAAGEMPTVKSGGAVTVRLAVVE